jgi:hypothetical protein
VEFYRLYWFSLWGICWAVFIVDHKKWPSDGIVKRYSKSLNPLEVGCIEIWDLKERKKIHRLSQHSEIASDIVREK